MTELLPHSSRQWVATWLSRSALDSDHDKEVPRVDSHHGTRVHRRASSYACFPVTASAIVGNEGPVGVALFMGGHTTPTRSYQRAHITLLDRAMLETASCECCAVVKAE